MKNVKYVIIAIACICLICGGFYLLTQNKPADGEKELTEVQKVILKDLEKDYPKTPREVVKLYNRIIYCYYSGEELTTEQVDKLVDQMWFLFDEEQKKATPRDEYYNRVVADIQSYRDSNKKVVNTDVCDSNEVMYATDKKDGSTEADEMAYVNTTYFVNTNGKFTYTYQCVELRKDEEGRWKIRTYAVVEGESSEDE